MTVYYTTDHEWVSVEGDTATCGISEHAQQALGDVVYVELPEAGRACAKGDAIAVVESVKAASEVYAPVSGTVTESNAELAADPSLVNADPLGKAWFFKLQLSDKAELDGLMDEAGYQTFLESV